MSSETEDHEPEPRAATRVGWKAIGEAMTRPYTVTFSMIVLVSLVPVYLLIAERVPRGTVHTLDLSWDQVFPVRPTWALIYGSLYVFLIVLPVIVVQQREHIRRTVFAYLTVWITAYVVFLAYPTVAPRPSVVVGQGFGAWGLRILYGADPPYNCFPSIHVAHSFVSALTCFRLHRGLAIVATVFASLVGLSTLYSKQHYVIDVVAGIALALVAYAIFLRGDFSEEVPEIDRKVAPFLALGVAAFIGIVVGCFWVAYRLTGAA